MNLFKKEDIGRVGIVSYCDHLRTYASVNHQYYANQHGYTYIYDTAPTLHTPFKNKIEKILKLLELFDWVFWIDDDAFFLKYNQPLDTFIRKKANSELIFCASPVNQGRWTYLSSGNFFLKNTPRVREFLQACLDTPLGTAQAAWKEEEWGIFTSGDQDIMVYLLHRDERFTGADFHTRYPYTAFNTRPFHFKKKPTEHFLVHFTDANKHQQALDFADKFHLSPGLIPRADFDDFKGVSTPGT